MIPQWLSMDNPALPASSGRGAHPFLERTIRGAAVFAAATFLNEDTARRDGFLQRIEPRFKLLAILSLMVCVSLIRSPWTAWGVYILTIPAARLSRVDIPFFLKRVWLVLPLFTAPVVIPAIFNFVIPGEPIWTAAHLGHIRTFGPYQIPAELAVTREGVAFAALFMGRAAASVSLALLISLTTPWNRLLQALNALGAPPLFTMTLAVAYCHIARLIRTVEEMHTARKSRTIRPLPTIQEQGWVASRIGFLFRKSYHMGRDMHDAMISRGFTGEMRGVSHGKLRIG